MANEQHVALLMCGAEAWNAWRERHPDVQPDLSMAHLTEAQLSKANLCGADLTYANLSKAYLADANLDGALLSPANLSHAYLIRASLRDANLNNAELLKADLSKADLGGASLCRADLAGACVRGVKWNPRAMRGRYQGIRGLDSCWGNALFKRAASDQDYLDTLEEHSRGSFWGRAMFLAWGTLDYGRSLLRVALLAAALVVLFGTIYALSPGILDYGYRARTSTPFTPFYFSIVTYTTLGFGDLRPANLYGEIVVSVEVVLGYVTLGLLLAVLAEKLARRS
ncbi:MAG: pentapeptide repeat-containing protein [Nevskia sp.]|nr:pentapeptide repeat-containing protein [Nevskia sp.]